MWNCHLNRNQDLFSRIMEERCQRHFRNDELPLPSHAKFQCLAGTEQFQRRVFGHLGGLGTHCQHCLTTLFPAFQYSPPWMPQVQLQWLRCGLGCYGCPPGRCRQLTSAASMWCHLCQYMSRGGVVTSTLKDGAAQGLGYVTQAEGHSESKATAVSPQ